MTRKWSSILRRDPIKPLLASGDKAIEYFVGHDLLDKTHLKRQEIWSLPGARAIVDRQQTDGSWFYKGGNHQIRTQAGYNQLETYRQLGYLIEMFGFDKSSPVIARAANFLSRFQSQTGDIRGILGNQYAPYYTAAIVELLVKAGYDQAPFIEKAFHWLSATRQDDGGWAIPLRTRGKKLDIISEKRNPLEPDRTKPFSHLVTGVVLRAYAAHPRLRHSKEARSAGKLLLASLFIRDSYPDRRAADYWLRFTFPFWFTDLLSALDSLTRLGFSVKEPQIERALQWFIDNQAPDGLWHLKVLKNAGYDTDLWLSLSICRILKRL